MLSQDKLNVVNKSRSNVFNWKGQFTPEFIEYLLDMFSKEGDLIADPFLGSGTVLIESIKNNCSCVGFEINPSAYYMSKFYEYSKLGLLERESIIQQSRSLLSKVLDKYQDDVKVYYLSNDYRKSYESLLALARQLADITSDLLKPFIINVLFLCEKDKKLLLKESILRNFDIMAKNLKSLPITNCSIEANLGDARKISEKYKAILR